MKVTRDQAITAGYTIDDTVYPPLAYKGERFAFCASQNTLTELESMLLEALRGVLNYEDDRPADGTKGSEVYAYADLVVARALAG
jgi:hypothetical protein